MEGKRLTENQRADFKDRSKRLYDQAEKSQRKTVDQYTKIADRNKLDPRDVVVDFETTIPKENLNQPSVVQDGQTATNPKTGQTITFKGGKWQ